MSVAEVAKRNGVTLRYGWRLDAATNDLAYMMAVHWYPNHRRLMERPLLDVYCAALLAHGVRG